MVNVFLELKKTYNGGRQAGNVYVRLALCPYKGWRRWAWELGWEHSIVNYFERKYGL